MLNNGIVENPFLIRNHNSINSTPICVEATNKKICKPFPSTKTKENCKKKCDFQFNSKTFFFDEKKSKSCFCGETQAKYQQFDGIEKECQDKSPNPCILKSDSFVNGKNTKTKRMFIRNIKEIDDQQSCQKECEKSMKSDGLLCDAKCYCINPNELNKNVPVKVVEKLVEKFSEKIDLERNVLKKELRNVTGKEDVIENMEQQCSKNDERLLCTDNKTYVVESDKGQFYNIGEFLGSGISDEVKDSFCSCDKIKSQVDKLKLNIGVINGKEANLTNIWQTAVENIEKCSKEGKDFKDIFAEFIKLFNSVTRSIQSNKNLLVAQEVCRIVNEKYSRTKPKPDNFTKDPRAWLNYHLSYDSASGRLLNNGLKALVMLVLIRLFLNSFQFGAFRQSLIYAMFLPKQFLAGMRNQKALVIMGSLLVMIFIMAIAYGAGSSWQTWTLFFSMIIIFVVMTFIGYFQDIEILKLSPIGILITLVLFVIQVSNEKEEKNNKKEDSFKNPGFITTLILVIIFSIMAVGAQIGSFLGVQSPFNFIDIVGFRNIAIILLMILVPILAILANVSPEVSNEGEAFIKYFFPNSLGNLAFSGLAFSIYAIVLGALLTRFGIPNGQFAIMIILVLFFIAGFVGVVIYASVNKISREEAFKNKNVIAFFLVTSVIYALIGISMFLPGMPNGIYSSVYALATVFGILPLATFAIVINFAIANLSPGISLFFIILYRISGMINAWFPGNFLGNIILFFFGKRSTDKWVMPFLPWISHFIKLFYTITGEPLPRYFNPGGVATGVTNTQLWMS